MKESKFCGIPARERGNTNGTRRTRRYTKEFKIEALNLANELGSAAEAGRRLGITDSLIHNWRKQFNYKSEAKVKDATVAVNEAEVIFPGKNGQGVKRLGLS